MGLDEQLATGEGGAGDGVGKGLRLGLCAGGSGESCLGFAWGGGMGEEVDFVGDGTA